MAVVFVGRLRSPTLLCPARPGPARPYAALPYPGPPRRCGVILLDLSPPGSLNKGRAANAATMPVSSQQSGELDLLCALQFLAQLHLECYSGTWISAACWSFGCCSESCFLVGYLPACQPASQPASQLARRLAWLPACLVPACLRGA